MCTPGCTDPAVPVEARPPIVLSRGREYIGVPWWLRLWWRAAYGVPLSDWVGCGCPRRLREWHDRQVFRWWGRLLAR